MASVILYFLIPLLFFGNSYSDEGLADDGIEGILLNVIAGTKCEYNIDVEYDWNDTLSIYWLDTNTGSYSQHLLKDIATEIFANSTFNASTPWVVYVHGWGSSATSDGSVTMKDAYATVPDLYFFIFDHSNYTSKSLNILTSYQNSVSYGFPLARNLVKYFYQPAFNSTNVTEDQIHMIGHSLGGQITGATGYILTNEGISLAKCTGLDPAGPCYNNDGNTTQLSAGDCKFVDIYHGNSGELGTDRFGLADLDVALNCAGKYQPYCFSLIDTCYPLTRALQVALYSTGLVSSCSHGFPVDFYAASLTNTTYNATPCGSFVDFREGNCNASETVVVGYGSDASGSFSGTYYLNTEDCECFLE